MSLAHKSTGVIDWLDQRLAFTKLMKVLVSEYWIPKNINFLWAMGVILTTLFMLLIVSGFLLLMYYKPDVNLALNKRPSVINDTQQNESVYLGTYNPDDTRCAAGIGWRFVYFRMAINVGLSRQ